MLLNTPQGKGLEAWRRLVMRFDPATAGRKRPLLRGVLQPGTLGNAQLRLFHRRYKLSSMYAKTMYRDTRRFTVAGPLGVRRYSIPPAPPSDPDTAVK